MTQQVGQLDPQSLVVQSAGVLSGSRSFIAGKSPWCSATRILDIFIMRIVFTSYVIIAIAACTTIVFVISLGPTSMTAFAIFTVWLLLPYGIMSAALALLKRRRIVFVPFYIVGALESVGGVVYLAYVIFGPQDAQGAFSVLATPILQAGTSVILLPIAFCVGGGSLQECDTPK